MRDGHKLTVIGVDKIKPTGVEKRYSDGHGLYLNVSPTGKKQWLFRYQRDGKTHWMGLGPLHTVSLKEAREKARHQRQLLLEHRDPLADKRVTRQRTMTFSEACEKYLAEKLSEFKNGKHRKQVQSTLARAYPVMGDLPLREIDSAVVLRALEPMKKTPETYSRTLGRVRKVFAWAKPLGLFVGDNPADGEMHEPHKPKKGKVKHHSALPYAELPARKAISARRLAKSALCLSYRVSSLIRDAGVASKAP
jgi:hypothetical protein